MHCINLAHRRESVFWANSADYRLNSFSFFFLFITKTTGFDVSCSGDNLHEVQIMFSWKNEKNTSKCRLLKMYPGCLALRFAQTTRARVCAWQNLQ